MNTSNIRNSCDVAILGAGPAGIATADTLQSAGYDCLIFDAGCIANNISRYPVYMEFFSSADRLEINGFPLICVSGKPSRREYLAYLSRFCRDRQLKLRLRESVESVEGKAGEFVVLSRTSAGGEARRTKARYVVLAAGAYDNPRPLGCPGEDLPKVSHYFTEVHPYVGSRVMVVGGGNSAVEAALDLYRAGVEVTLVVRREKFGFVKYWILPDIEGRIRDGDIAGHFETSIAEVRPLSVVLRKKSGESFEIENDFVLAMTGYQPDTSLLRACGVEFDEKTKRPRYDLDTLETNVPGLFVAGVIAAGNISAEIFIENSRHHGTLILKALQ